MPFESVCFELGRQRVVPLRLRVHIRAGGRIHKVAPRSMVSPGTLKEWRAWTGLPFDHTGPVEVPKTLAPVWCDAEDGVATYVEPNVWVRHRTGA